MCEVNKTSGGKRYDGAKKTEETIKTKALMKVAKRNFEKVLSENLKLLIETNSNISESGRMTKVLKIIYQLHR